MTMHTAQHPLSEKGVQVRAAILDSLDKAVAATPWREVSIRDVMRGAGKSIAVFYYYFRDLDEAMEKLAEERYRSKYEPLPEHLRMILELCGYEKSWMGTAT